MPFLTLDILDAFFNIKLIFPIDLNLPLTGIALVFCIFCLDLKVPKRTLVEKLKIIDWVYAVLKFI